MTLTEAESKQNFNGHHIQTSEEIVANNEKRALFAQNIPEESNISSAQSYGETPEKKAAPKRKRKSVYAFDTKRYRLMTNVEAEIAYYQSTTDLLIPKVPFCHLVKEITEKITNCPSVRYKVSAIQALREATESFTLGVLEDSYLLMGHANRKTLFPKDIRLAQRLRVDVSR